MISLLGKLDYERYYKASQNLFSHNGIKNKLVPLECDKEDEDMLFNCNFFHRGALDYFLVSPNIYHLNKLSTTLYNYYSSSYKDVVVIPYDASIDAYTRLNNTFVIYVISMLEKYLNDKEIVEYRKAAEKDHVYGLSEELNLSAYFLHIITKINEKNIKVLFIVNNAHLVDRIEMNFQYNRRETFVRFLLTSTVEPKEIYDEAKIITFDNRNNDIFIRSSYVENELEKKLGLIERKRFLDTYRKFDTSYIDVLINIINNLEDEKTIKAVLTNKGKVNDALGFMNLLINSTPSSDKCYMILPLIYASPLGINNETLKQLFIAYSDQTVKDNIVNLMKLLPSVVYLDNDNNYRLYDNIFIKEIGDIYAFDIFHASNILIDKIKVKDKKDTSFAINYFYYLYKSNRKNGLELFLNNYSSDPLLCAMTIDYIVTKYEDGARDYIRNYLHLLDDKKLSFILHHLADTYDELDLKSEYTLAILDRIRQIVEDRYTADFSKERMHLLYDALYIVGNMEGDLGRELNKTMYHFHAYIYSNEYYRLYKEELFDDSSNRGASLALEYTRKIRNDKIDKKIRYSPIDEFDLYDLRIHKYLDRDELYNAKILFLELLNSYSFNYKDRSLDIIELYQSFNFHLEINDTLMFYYLYLLVNKKDINSKIATFINRRYLDEFKE